MPAIEQKKPLTDLQNIFTGRGDKWFNKHFITRFITKSIKTISEFIYGSIKYINLTPSTSVRLSGGRGIFINREASGEMKRCKVKK